jgi:transposase
MSSPHSQAQQRALLILEVKAGRMTATEAARQLGLSRKSYYQWEKRALEAILESQEQKPPGRPPKEPDTEKEELRRRVIQLEQQVSQLNQLMELRHSLAQFQQERLDSKKNSRSCLRSSLKAPPLSPPSG